MQAFHRMRIYQNKRNIKNIQNLNTKTSYKYEKVKSNKYTEKGFYKNALKYSNS